MLVLGLEEIVEIGEEEALSKRIESTGRITGMRGERCIVEC